MPTAELDILLPADVNGDSDEYFELSNVHVYGSNGKAASLLSAYADVPLRVEGRLEPPNRSMTKRRESSVPEVMSFLADG